MRRCLSGLLMLVAVAVLTVPSATAAGPAPADLAVPDGSVGVIARGVIPSVDGGPATVVAIIGNGTAAPVNPRVAWAAMDPAGELLWAGLPAGYTWNGSAYQTYLGPETLQPGGIGIAIDQARDLPADASYTFAVRTDEPGPDASVIALSDVIVQAGHLVGTVRNAASQPFDLSSTWLPVVAVCLDAQGSPASVHGTSLLGDGTALAPGASIPFDVDLGGATCDRFLVVA